MAPETGQRESRSISGSDVLQTAQPIQQKRRGDNSNILHTLTLKNIGARQQTVRDFRLPPQSIWNLPSSGTLRSGEWQFLPDVSGQHIGPIFKCQEIQKESRIFFLDFLPLKIGPICCSETSGRNYHYTLRNVPEEGSSDSKLILP